MFSLLGILGIHEVPLFVGFYTLSLSLSSLLLNGLRSSLKSEREEMCGESCSSGAGNNTGIQEGA